jgi:hypothetical protein
MWLKENRVLCITRSTHNITKTNKITHVKAIAHKSLESQNAKDETLKAHFG